MCNSVAGQMKIVSSSQLSRFAAASFQSRHYSGKPSMNERTIRRRIIDQTEPSEIAQQVRDATDVLRIAMGEHQPCEPIHAGPVQILAHDALVTAFAPAIKQPVAAFCSQMNRCTSTKIQHRDFR